MFAHLCSECSHKDTPFKAERYERQSLSCRARHAILSVSLWSGAVGRSCSHSTPRQLNDRLQAEELCEMSSQRDESHRAFRTQMGK